MADEPVTREDQERLLAQLRSVRTDLAFTNAKMLVDNQTLLEEDITSISTKVFNVAKRFTKGGGQDESAYDEEEKLALYCNAVGLFNTVQQQQYDLDVAMQRLNEKRRAGPTPPPPPPEPEAPKTPVLTMDEKKAALRERIAGATARLASLAEAHERFKAAMEDHEAKLQEVTAAEAELAQSRRAADKELQTLKAKLSTDSRVAVELSSRSIELGKLIAAGNEAARKGLSDLEAAVVEAKEKLVPVQEQLAAEKKKAETGEKRLADIRAEHEIETASQHARIRMMQSELEFHNDTPRTSPCPEPSDGDGATAAVNYDALVARAEKVSDEMKWLLQERELMRGFVLGGAMNLERVRERVHREPPAHAPQ